MALFDVERRGICLRPSCVPGDYRRASSKGGDTATVFFLMPSKADLKRGSALLLATLRGKPLLFESGKALPFLDLHAKPVMRSAQEEM